MVARYRQEGRVIAGYAAASKATVICNYLGLTGEDVAYCCDGSALKQGRMIPGADIPIREPQALTRDPPDVVIVFAWNIFDEITRVIGSLTSKPLSIIRPLPEIEVVTAPAKAPA
jgi:hypothetical protein